MTYNYRCTSSKCRQRVTKRHKIEWYMHDHHRECKACGGKLSYDPEPKRRAQLQRCNCNGYWFPHRIGSLWCEHYRGEIDPDEMYNRGYHLGR